MINQTRSILTKAIAVFISFTLLYQNISWAVDLSSVRDQQRDNLTALELLAEGRRQSNPYIPQHTYSSGNAAMAQSAVDQQNTLQGLNEDLNFTLTTENDDILEYVNGTLNKITTKKNTILEGIELNSDGTVKDALITYADRSIQELVNGQINEYERGDGTRAVFNPENGRITTIIKVATDEAPEEVLARYKHDDDESGAILKTTVTTVEGGQDKDVYVYDENNFLISVIKEDGSEITMIEGRISEIKESNGNIINYDVVEDYGAPEYTPKVITTNDNPQGGHATTEPISIPINIGTLNATNRSELEEINGEDSLGIRTTSQSFKYTVPLERDGDLRLKLDCMNFDSESLPGGYTHYELEIHVDGMSKKTVSVAASIADWQNMEVLIEDLTSGDHEVEIKWLNDESPQAGSVPDHEWFKNIGEGSALSGTVMIDVDTTAFPLGVDKAFFYIGNGEDCTLINKSYDGPFRLGGVNGFDTTNMPDGNYSLGVMIDDYIQDNGVNVNFTVANNSPPVVGGPDSNLKITNVDFTLEAEETNASGDANLNIPQEITYALDGAIQEIKTFDQKVLTFNEGVLISAVDSLGESVDFELLESDLGNITQARMVLEDESKATFDDKGQLIGVEVGDMTIRYKDDHTGIDFVMLADGTEIYDPEVDEAGVLDNARIYDTDGNTIIYQNKAIVYYITPDLNEYGFDAGVLETLTTPEDYVYSFGDGQDGDIIASLNVDPNIEIPDATVQSYLYDSAYNIKEVIRKNGEIISYIRNDQGISQITTESDNATTIYDEFNNPISSVITPKNDGDPLIDVEYEYGKIRNVYKDDVLTFTYTYTFDENGEEITNVEDLEEKKTKLYMNGLLASSLDQETKILSEYEYDADDKVKTVKNSRLSRTLHEFSYSYRQEGDEELTVVEDEEGIIRTYSEDRSIKYLKRDNDVFEYLHHQNDDGEKITEEFLKTKTLSDGSIVTYEKGNAKRIERPDGIILEDVVLNEKREIISAAQLLADGTKRIFNHEEVVEIVRPDQVHIYYEAGRIKKIKDVDGFEYEYSYDFNNQGDISNIYVQKDKAKLKYDAQGNLLGLELDGGLLSSDPSYSLKNAAYFTAGGDGYAHDRFRIFDGEYTDAFGNGSQTGRASEDRVWSLHEYASAQKITAITCQLAAHGYARGDSINTRAEIYVEVYKNGAWQKVGGTHFADGSTTRPGIITLNSLNITGVTKIRAYAHAFGDASGGEEYTNSEAYIHEFQVDSIADYAADGDMAFLEYTEEKDASGNTAGYSFSGKLGDILYDAQGNFESYTEGSNLPDMLQGILPFQDKSAYTHYVKAEGVTLNQTNTLFDSYNALFDGNDYLYMQQSEQWELGMEDFTMETRFSLNEIPQAGMTIFDVYGQEAGMVVTLKEVNGAQKINIYTDKKNSYDYDWDPELGVWHHLAVSRKDHVVKVFLDGKQIGDDITDATMIRSNDNMDESLRIGVNGYGQNYFKGLLDEVRITKGLSRYEENFDVMTQRFSRDENTVLLLHYDDDVKNAKEITQSTSVDLQADLMRHLDLPLNGEVDFQDLLPSEPNITDWIDTAQEATLDAGFMVAQEYSEDGVMETQRSADGNVTLFEGNKPFLVVDKDGNALVKHYYDEDGNPTQVYLNSARETLPHQIEKARATIESERARVLRELAQYKECDWDGIERNANNQILELETEYGGMVSQIEQAVRDLEATDVHGKEDKKNKSKQLDQMRGNIEAYYGAIANIRAAEAEAYKQLDTEIKNRSEQVEIEAEKALLQLADQERQMKHEILRQELSPIIYDNYRRILGRDPTKEEYQQWIETVQYEDITDPEPPVLIGDDPDDPGDDPVDDPIDDPVDPTTLPFMEEGGLVTVEAESVHSIQSGVSSSSWEVVSGDSRYSGGDYIKASGDSLWGSNYQDIEQIYPMLEYKVHISTPGTYYLWFRCLANDVNSDSVHAGLDGEINPSSYKLQRMNAGSFSWSTGNYSGADKTVFNITEAGEHTINFWMRETNFTLDKFFLTQDPSFTPQDMGPEQSQRFGVASSANTSNESTPEEPATSSVMADFVDDLRTSIGTSQEFADRTEYVQEIKTNVKTEINSYIAGNNSDLLTRLNLSQEEVVNLDPNDVQAILSWIDSRTLHFGQSAFLSLEALMDSKDIPYTREDIARDCILVDILSGVITPLDEGDLVISIFALNKVASMYGLDLAGAQMGWDDLRNIIQDNSDAFEHAHENEQDIQVDDNAPKLVAHISSNHYVIIVGMTENTITYIDPGIGEDGNNEVLSVTKEGFLKEWKGFVTGETQKIEQASQEIDSQIRLLSADEEMRIRGAFWGSILNMAASICLVVPGLQFLSIPLRIAALAVSIAEGDWFSAISAAFMVGFGEGGLFTSFFANAMSGVATALGQIGTFVTQVFTTVSGFISDAANFLGGFLGGAEWAVELAKGALQYGMQVGINKGFDAMGVDSEVVRYATSFAVGTVTKANDMGEGDTFADCAMSGFDQVIYDHGKQDLGMVLSEINPNLASFALTALDIIWASDFSDSDTFSDMVRIIQPDVMGSMAQYGIYELGDSLGLDPRISGIVGSTFGAGIGTAFQDGVVTGQEIITSIQESMTDGALLYGVTELAEGITDDRLLQSMLSRTFAGGIEGLLNPDQTIIDGVFDAYEQSLTWMLGGNAEGFMMNAIDFAVLVSDVGLEQAFERCATSIFDRATIESVARSGGFLTALSTPKSDVFLPDGTIMPGVKLSDGTYVLFNQVGVDDYDFAGIMKYGSAYVGEFGIGHNGEFGLINGDVITPGDNQIYFKQEFTDGELITAKDNNVEICKVGEDTHIKINIDQALDQEQQEDLASEIGVDANLLQYIALTYIQSAAGGYNAELSLSDELIDALGVVVNPSGIGGDLSILLKTISDFLEDRGIPFLDNLLQDENSAPLVIDSVNKSQEELSWLGSPSDFANYPQEIRIRALSKEQIIGQTLISLIYPFAGAVFDLDAGDYKGALTSVGISLLTYGIQGGVFTNSKKFNDLGANIIDGVDTALMTKDKIQQIKDIAVAEVVNEALMIKYMNMVDSTRLLPENQPPVQNSDGSTTYFPENVLKYPEIRNGVLYIPFGDPIPSVISETFQSGQEVRPVPPLRWGIDGLNMDGVQNVANEFTDALRALIENNWVFSGSTTDNILHEALENIARRYEVINE